MAGYPFFRKKTDVFPFVKPPFAGKGKPVFPEGPTVVDSE
jgi:hypothetical protein